MDQLNLFISHQASNQDPYTSHKSAEEVKAEGIIKTQTLEILDALRDHPGHTSNELAALSGLDRHNCAKRLPILANEKNKLARKGAIRTDLISGRSAYTWYPVERETAPEVVQARQNRGEE